MGTIVASTPLTSKQEVIDLINQVNTSNLTVNDVSFSLPAIVAYQSRNTKLTVSAVPGSAYAGSVDVYYNRLLLTDLGYIGIQTVAPLDFPGFLQAISAQENIDLLPEEFSPVTMPAIDDGGLATIQLVALSTALKWYGQTSADYALNLPPELPALHQMINVTLPAPGYL